MRVATGMPPAMEIVDFAEIVLIDLHVDGTRIG
jgi:hypothetical protein